MALLSQDCDLEHDFNNHSDSSSKDGDKYLPFLLLCPAFPAEAFRQGKHLAELNIPMSSHNSDAWRKLKTNNLSRYHFLPGDTAHQVPDLVVDFKQYLTIPRDIIYRSNYQKCYLATIEIVFRDNISNRFAHYLSRIGLPELSPA